ncbi:hypothetical protein LNJ05_12105 [Tenacibaculum finnmarkense genomovar ulcerans]|uniref:hypothetical protein n=3 Tax=Tenacibaculum finnmarkense TaxID=2781243 RepID=UPI00187B17AE|nr:hypothetical protein [Tenacibaculum finnmarkense]MBE7635094.1 hypothetical protein [Tenacibaculum finnmarkense genomovar ulcerans]MCD8403859.1 hypothetical protein [Tenacibaculum finnmarkense genomovar finnmarkense]MCD8431028.1 hypothetical protein [Tenacibaculum finnmarkense genomovar ulcerans]MCD8433504.1 hypothetical protein [Tenacibaculum finnmarkense genomovar ulcerans]WCC41175.1 hypothetical protein PJJ26_00020 [Tenacibaculum finnmarkense]
MYIKTTLNGTTTDDQEIACEMTSNSVAINFETIVEPHIKDANTIQWKIIYNGDKTVDENDYTGGKKAEIKIYKEHAGTKEKPATLIVQSYYKGTVFSSVIIKLYATPEIVSAIWSSGGYEATTVQNQQKVAIYIDGKGLSGQTLNVNIFDKEDPGTIIDSKSILKTQSEAFTEWVARNSSEEDKTFFLTVNHKETELYRSKDLMVVAHTKRRELPEIPVNLTPVTVYTEEYFTQAYEPCKYTKIEVTIGAEAPITIFDEETPASSLSNTLQKLILCGSDTRTIKIELANLKTDECRLSLEGNEETHQSTIFDVTELDKFNIEYSPKEQIKEQLEINLIYPYQHIDDLWEFLLQYNHITLPLRTIPVSLPIETCRYSKHIAFSLLPDVSWAFHFQWGNPREHLSEEAKCSLKQQYGATIVKNLQGNKVFYEENKVTLYDKGLVKEIDAIINWINELNPYVKSVIDILFGSEFVRDIMFNYIKGASLDFKVGLHAFYNYDDEGKNPLSLSYTDEYPSVAKSIVGAAVAVNLLVDIALLFLTRGKNLPVLLAKAQKVYKFTRRLTGKVLKVNTYTQEDKGLKIIPPQLAYANGVGYKKQEDGSISVIQEYILTAAPLFAISDIKKWDIGIYISEVVGIKGFFDKFHKTVGTLQDIKHYGGKIKGKLIQNKSVKGKTTIGLDSLRDIREGAYKIENEIEDTISGFVEKHFGAKAEMLVAFEGFYDAHIALKTNISTQSFDLFDGLNHFISDSEVTFGKKQGIDGIIKIDATLKKEMKFSKWNKYIPDFLQDLTGQEFADVSVDAKLDGSIKGSLYFERTFTYNVVTATAAVLDRLSGSSIAKSGAEKGVLKMPHYRDNYIFTGLIGELTVIIEVEKDKRKGWGKKISNGKDDKGKDKPVVMTFIPPYVIPGELTPVFEEPKK